MDNFTWIYKDYQNRSLNNLAQNITEYHTSMLLNQGVEVNFSYDCNINNNSAVMGSLFTQDKFYQYTVEDLEVVNMLADYNIYFKMNNEDLVDVGYHRGTYDCLVSLAAGDILAKLPNHIGLTGNHYIVDISATAIRCSNNYFKEIFEKEITDHQQLDFFNIQDVKNFLDKVTGSKGLFIVSNCFCYAPTSLWYDTNLRLKKQNEFINLLANHHIDWYLDIVTADGRSYRNVQAKELINLKITDKLKVLPWI